MTIIKVRTCSDGLVDTSDSNYKLKGKHIPRLSRVDKDRNVILSCHRCKTDILMSTRRAAVIQLNQTESGLFCSPLCKIQYLTKGKKITDCWLFPKTTFVFDGKGYAMRVMLYHIHFGESLHGRNLWSSCGERRCVNPHHAEKRCRRITEHE